MLRADLMVQQQVSSVWQHMVGVMCLNQTARTQVKKLLPQFFLRWPGPELLLRARICDIEHMLQPLGMHRVRARRIYRMSIDYLTWDHCDATQLYGIGKYGSDSYEIFYNNNYTTQPTDKELKKYLRDHQLCG